MIITRVAGDRLDARRVARPARLPGDAESSRVWERGFGGTRRGAQVLEPHVHNAAEPAIRRQPTNINNLEPGYLVDNGTRDRVPPVKSAALVTQK